ncbi:unnamed protein product [[Candida] boidinii]|nr:unnamed protein product [[Candida] boidinii]
MNFHSFKIGLDSKAAPSPLDDVLASVVDVEVAGVIAVTGDNIDVVGGRLTLAEAIEPEPKILGFDVAAPEILLTLERFSSFNNSDNEFLPEVTDEIELNLELKIDELCVELELIEVSCKLLLCGLSSKIEGRI